jgi:hypothetical protein
MLTLEALKGSKCDFHIVSISYQNDSVNPLIRNVQLTPTYSAINCQAIRDSTFSCFHLIDYQEPQGTNVEGKKCWQKKKQSIYGFVPQFLRTIDDAGKDFVTLHCILQGSGPISVPLFSHVIHL